MTEPSHEDRIREYIATMKQHYATYHNHKEQMAYVATALYLTGASALFFQKPPPGMQTLSYQCLIIPLVMVFSGAAFVFIKWQFDLRAISVDIVAACDRLRLQWLSNPQFSLDVSCKQYKKCSVTPHSPYKKSKS